MKLRGRISSLRVAGCVLVATLAALVAPHVDILGRVQLWAGFAGFVFVAVAIMVSPWFSSLAFDDQGLTSRSLGRRFHARWSDITRLRIVGTKLDRRIEIDMAPQARRHRIRIRIRVGTQADELILPSTYGMRAEELLSLMERARDGELAVVRTRVRGPLRRPG